MSAMRTCCGASAFTPHSMHTPRAAADLNKGKWATTLPNGATIRKSSEVAAYSVAVRYGGTEPVYTPRDDEEVELPKKKAKTLQEPSLDE